MPDLLAMRLLLTVLDVVTKGALIFLDELPDQRLVIRCLVADLLCLAGFGQQAADLKTSQKHIPSGNLKSRILGLYLKPGASQVTLHQHTIDQPTQGTLRIAVEYAHSKRFSM